MSLSGRTQDSTSFYLNEIKTKNDLNAKNIEAIRLKSDSILFLLTAQNGQKGELNGSNAAEKHTAEVDSLNEKIKAVQNELNLARQTIEKELREKDRALQNLKSNLESQKTFLRAEIKALDNQSFTVEKEFLTNMKARSEQLEGLENYTRQIQDFISKRELLIKAEAALNKPYDANVSVILNELNKEFTGGQPFAKLKKEKEQMVSLLEEYCYKTSDLKDLLSKVDKLNTIKSQRDALIYENMYIYVDYKYLIDIMRRNLNDFKYNPIINSKTDC